MRRGPSPDAQRLVSDRALAWQVLRDYQGGLSTRRNAKRHGLLSATVRHFISADTVWARELHAELEREAA